MIEYLYNLDYQVEDVQSLPSESVGNETEPEKPENNGPDGNGVESLGPSNTLAGEGVSPTPSAGGLPKTANHVSDHIPPYDPLSFHILIYSLADRLFIHGRKELSKQKVERELLQRLDVNSFSRAVIEVYKSTPPHERGLRDLAVKITMDHMTELRTRRESVPAALEDRLLEQVPQFTYDLLVAMMNTSVRDWNLNGVCRKNWSVENFSWY